MIPTEYYTNPKYFEMIRRATGLLDSEQREKRIKKIAEHNILLAAQCKVTCVDEEFELVNFLTKIAEKDAIYFDKPKLSMNGLIALIELDCYDNFIKLLYLIDSKNIKHNQIFEKLFLMENINIDIKLEITNLILNTVETKRELTFLIFRFCKTLNPLNKIILDKNNVNKVLKICNFLLLLDKENPTAISLTLKLIYIFNLSSFFKKIEIINFINVLINKYQFVSNYQIIINLGFEDQFSPDLVVNRYIENKSWIESLIFINKFKLNMAKYSQKILPLIISSIKITDVSKIYGYSKILDQYNYPMENIITTITCRIKSSLETGHPSHVPSILEIIKRYNLPIEDYMVIAIQRVDNSFENYFSQEIDKSLSIFKQIYTIDNDLYLIIQKWINIVFNRNKLNKINKIKLLKKIDAFISSRFCQKNITQHQLIEIKELLQEKIEIIVEQKIEIYPIQKCKIISIIPSRIFVEIENETRRCSIFIGELSNSYIPDIYDFKYNGEKLYIGQNLIAKVISIDKKYGINLSIKALNEL
jgi:hypothetical protein